MTIDTEQILWMCEKIYHRYGYDFRHYNSSSLSRRVLLTMKKCGTPTFDAFCQKILDDPDAFRRLVESVSINVTSMFRDPEVFLFLRQKILPRLATFPHIRIWVAGVASGEEAYSLAILLKEDDLYHRCLIYATDFNPVVLRKAQEGVCNLDKMAEYTGNYIKAGGREAFSRYYKADHACAHFDKSLLDNIVFSTHNLVTDGVFNEFHLVMCRNVLIYFDAQLKQRALRLFEESLVYGGSLCLGKRENVAYQCDLGNFMVVDKKYNLYQRG